MKKLSLWAALGAAMMVLSSCAAVLVGATGAVVGRSVLEERTTMAALEDTEVQLGLNNRLLNQSGALFADVSTSVIEGRVVLTGTVPTREDKIAATRIAWETPGVLAVTDELEVREDSGTIAYAEDAWISNQLRVNLLTDMKVSSVNYSVETVDKVVHLTGIARSTKELGRVIDHASSVPGVEKVVSHVLTIDDPRRQARGAPEKAQS